MSENQCCICLVTHGTEVCDTCSCHACPSCWSSYKLRQNGQILRCPLCRSECNPGIQTRSCTFSTRQSKVIANMRELLYTVDTLQTLTPEKSRLIHTIFRSLCSYKGTDIDLMKNISFRKACQEKLRSFYYTHNFSGAAGYYTRLFGEAITKQITKRSS